MNGLTMYTINAVGILGAILLALCGAPQAYMSFKNKHSDGVSTSFALMWFFGEVMMLIYVAQSLDWILIGNYVFNIFLVGIILYYKVFTYGKRDIHSS